MPLTPAAYRKTAYTHRIGTRANQPDAADVLEGTLYFVTDEFVLERSNGTSWVAYSGVPDPLTVNDLTVNNILSADLITGMTQVTSPTVSATNQTLTPLILGGIGAGSDLTLQSTNNGSPSGDEVKIQLENNPAIKFVRDPGGGIAGVFGDSTLKYTFAPANSNQVEFAIDTDINFNVAKSTTATTGVAFQSYNDAVNANIPLEFRGNPIILGTGALTIEQHVNVGTLAVGNNNDLTVAFLAQSQLLVVAGAGGGSVLTGIVPTIDGVSYNRILHIFNIGSNFTITHNDAASSAANRFFTPAAATITVLGNEIVTFLYYPSIARWFQMT